MKILPFQNISKKFVVKQRIHSKEGRITMTNRIRGRLIAYNFGSPIVILHNEPAIIYIVYEGKVLTAEGFSQSQP